MHTSPGKSKREDKHYTTTLNFGSGGFAYTWFSAWGACCQTSLTSPLLQVGDHQHRFCKESLTSTSQEGSWGTIWTSSVPKDVSLAWRLSAKVSRHIMIIFDYFAYFNYIDYFSEHSIVKWSYEGLNHWEELAIKIEFKRSWMLTTNQKKQKHLLMCWAQIRCLPPQAF
jgi:hypothetical protein